jgi:glyoxylase-like metal-dependent hydrolase (beta-lactamase superfamily II)
VAELGASVEWILETHVHADHLSAAPYLKGKLGGKIGIGQHITSAAVFGKLFNAEPEMARDGSQFDHLFSDNEEFQIGTLSCRAMHTPGHTPACMTYVSATRARAPPLSATPCSCRTTAPPAATSPAAMPARCSAPSTGC